MVNIKIQTFEGPLALLLYLIRKEEMDIFDINIHQITRQYLDYIKSMKSFDLEVAGEFISMAATLIHIKSKMLIPSPEEKEEKEEIEDPRHKLVERLLQYERFKKLATFLNQKELLNRDVWPRGKKDISYIKKDGGVVLGENSFMGFLKAYVCVLHKAKKKTHKVFVNLQTIGERILDLRSYLKLGVRQNFNDFIFEKEKEKKRYQVLVTLLSFLELSKLGHVGLFQGGHKSDIYVETKKAIDKTITSRIEDYTSSNNQEI